MIHTTVTDEKIDLANRQVLQMMSSYLNNAPDYIKTEVVEDIHCSCGVTLEYAYAVLLAAACGMDIDETTWDHFLFHQYFIPMLHQVPYEKYIENPYYKKIQVPEMQLGRFEFKKEVYQPYEAFVCNDLVRKPNGQILPQIGYFNQKFTYPAVLEEGRIWMTITPNEIETMEHPIQRAHGNVLTFGLGLGYFAYMASEKEEVSQVTIVDSSEEVISLFTNYILPQFPHQSKVHIIHSDAFHYARTHLSQCSYDYVFTDLWHDVSDGIALYQEMKKLEVLSPETEFAYWIEKSIQCYCSEEEE